MHRIQEKFIYLSNDDIKELSKHSEIVQYNKDTIIIEYGKYEPYFYYVLEGIVRGYVYTNSGKEHNLFFIHNNQYFVSPDKFFNKEKKINTFIFEAVTDITAFKIHHDKLMELAPQTPAFFEFYHDAMKAFLKSFMNRIQLLTIENAEERYKHLEATRPLLPLNAQKKHLAQFLGITPNSFSRLLKKIQKNDRNS